MKKSSNMCLEYSNNSSRKVVNLLQAIAILKIRDIILSEQFMFKEKKYDQRTET